MQPLPFNGGFGMIESSFPNLFFMIFAIVFIIILGTFVFVAVRGLGQFLKNEASPVLSVDALLVSKRTDVSHRHSSNTEMSGHTVTSYYVTFQVESGDRMEFAVSGEVYGLLAERDTGRLTFQGTRFLSFERNKE